MGKSGDIDKQSNPPIDAALLTNAKTGEDLSSRGARLTDLRQMIHSSPRVRQLRSPVKLAGQKSAAGANPVLQRVPLDIPTFRGSLGKTRDNLDSADKQGLWESLFEAHTFNDDQYIQKLLANLRVRDPAAFVAVDAQYKLMQSLSPRDTLGRGKKYLGQGSYGADLFPIERNIHRFWAGGPMSETTFGNIMAMHEKVMESREGPGEDEALATPWSHVIWTSGLANQQFNFFGRPKDNPLDEQLEQLREVGVEIRDMDQCWPTLEREFPGITAKGLDWTKQAKVRMDKGDYQPIKFLSDLVRLIAIFTEGGVYMDTDIGPGSLNLKNHELFHFDKDGQIPHHGPAYRVPKDLTRVNKDANLGETPKERQIAHADREIPVLNYFLASRSHTSQIGNEIRDFVAQDSLKSGMGTFARMFAPPGTDPAKIIEELVSSEDRVTPWVGDLQWTTDASQGEG